MDLNLDNLYVGMRVKNYKELCGLLGIEPEEGNSKKSQLKELGRYFHWERDGHAYLITEIYEKKKPKEFRSDDKYSKDIYTCLLWDFEHKRFGRAENHSDYPSMSYTLPSILDLCGFTKSSWTTAEHEMREEYQSAVEDMPSSLYAEVGVGGIKRLFKEFDVYVAQYCGGKIDNSLNSLTDKEYLLGWGKVLWIETYLKDTRIRVRRRATPAEFDAYLEVEAQVKKEMGIIHPQLGKKQQFYSEVKWRAEKEHGFEPVARRREIIFAEPPESVSGCEYIEARKRINEKSTEAFKRRARSRTKADIDKTREWVFDNADEDTREVLELLEYSPEEIYRSVYHDSELDIETREYFASWFIDMDR